MNQNSIKTWWRKVGHSCLCGDALRRYVATIHSMSRVSMPLYKLNAQEIIGRGGGGGSFFLECKDLGERFDESFSACGCCLLFLFLFFLHSDQFARVSSFLYARISPQWFSKRRQLWKSVSVRVACELISLISSHTMPRKHSQPNTDFVGSRVYPSLGVTCHLHF